MIIPVPLRGSSRHDARESAPRACRWCGRTFSPHRGGSQQTYCRAACRAAYHKAARQWCERAIADGRLAVEDLRNSIPVAYALPGCSEPPLPLSDIERGYTAPGDAVPRFIVDVERSKLAWLVRFGLIRPDQHDDLDLLAIMTGLKCLGQPPRISRIT